MSDQVDPNAMAIDEAGSPAPLGGSSMTRNRSSSATAPKPKGILKNPSTDVVPGVHRASQHERTNTADITAANTAFNTPAPTDDAQANQDPFSNNANAAPPGSIAARRTGQPVNLTWDEENLQAAAAQGGGKMKITEPKTPYVRYNAETDEVENMDDIPNFDLGGASSAAAPATTSDEIVADGEGNAAGPSAIAGEQIGGVDGQPRRPSAPSRSSSRSVSINSGSRRNSSARRESRGSEPVVDFEKGAADGVSGSALDTSDGEDEDDVSTWDPEKREQHEKFAALRHRHYSNEAEAMKRAQELMKRDEEDEEEEAEDSEPRHDDIEEDDDESGSGPAANGNKPNGVGKHKVPPPVPEVPSQFRS